MSCGTATGVKVHPPGTWDKPTPRVGVLFIDEIGQVEEDVQKPMAELIYNGKVGTLSLPIGWRVIGATNRTADRSGVARTLMFIVNRRKLMKVTPEVQPWVDWADSLPENKKLHEGIITFAQAHPQVVFKESVPEGDQPFCTPRTLVMTDRDLKSLQTQEDIDNNKLPMTDLARESVAGLIGEGSAGQLFAHLRHFHELPTVDEINADPMKAKLPSGNDGQMVCVYMMSRQITSDNADNVITYVKRLNAEMQLLACSVFNGTAAVQKVLLSTRAYQDLLQKHKPVLVAGA